MINTAHLSVESAPPIQIPYRFLLTAPLFGVLFSLLLLFEGGEMVASRWSPQLIGSLHLLNIGVLMMVVSGVLFQMLPVVGGVQFPGIRPLSTLLHLSLSLGALLLFAGMQLSQPLLLSLSLWVLVLGLLPYLLLLLWILFLSSSPPEWVRLLRYVAPFLLLLAGLGVMLLMGWSDHSVSLKRGWTDIHAVWGLGGWFTLLLMATSFQLIPMFQVTPEFPYWFKRWLVPLIALSLLLWGGGKMVGLGIATDLLLMVSAIGVALYGVVTLYLLKQRKRKIFDATVLFWQVALLSLTVGAGVLLSSQLLQQPIPSLLALVWIFAVLLPMLAGMILKIAPFLVFLHLQQQMIRNPEQMGNLATLPNLFQILPTRWSRALLVIYLVTLCTGLLSIYTPALLQLTGVGLLLFFSWLGWIVYHCYRVYNASAL